MSNAAWEAAAELAARGGAVSTIFDIGGNRGRAAEFLLHRFPDAMVHCFEPNPEALAQLRTKLQQHDRARIHPVAVSSSDGTTTFHQGARDDVSSLYPRNSTGHRYFRADLDMKATTEVETASLDTFCAEQNIASVQLMKIDVQGGELEVLLGGQNRLAANTFDVIVAEGFLVPHYESAPLLDEVYSFVSGYGYTAYDLFKGPTATNGQLRFCDMIYVSAPFRERVLNAVPSEL